MKNLIGSLIGVLIGSFILVNIIPLSQPPYPSPYDFLWVLLTGSQALQMTIQQLLSFQNVFWYLLTWILIGIVTSPFSDSRWNAVRTSIWVGVFIMIFSLASLLLLDPAFWVSETRNWELIIQLITSILTSSISLLSSLPLVVLISKVKEKSETPLPEKIETICECGAVFKSRPMICSECGKTLHVQEEKQ